jgi:hypothetical protein
MSDFRLPIADSGFVFNLQFARELVLAQTCRLVAGVRHFGLNLPSDLSKIPPRLLTVGEW